jgi:hypothetical protein
VDPVPDPLLLRKAGSVGNRARTSGHQTTEALYSRSKRCSVETAQWNVPYCPTREADWEGTALPALLVHTGVGQCGAPRTGIYSVQLRHLCFAATAGIHCIAEAFVLCCYSGNVQRTAEAFVLCCYSGNLQRTAEAFVLCCYSGNTLYS